MNHPRDWNRPDLGGVVPSRDAILDALGLEPRRSSASVALDGLALFGAGVLVGAGLALLFAPRAEPGTRRQAPDPPVP